jgi:hypothetical protein
VVPWQVLVGCGSAYSAAVVVALEHLPPFDVVHGPVGFLACVPAVCCVDASCAVFGVGFVSVLVVCTRTLAFV